jgi:hypothetical protein
MGNTQPSPKTNTHTASTPEEEKKREKKKREKKFLVR